MPDAQHSYNAARRLAEIQTETLTARYTYNALGQRTSKSVTENGQTTTTYFLYDEQGMLIAEINGAGQTMTHYLSLNHQPLAQLRGSQIYYYHNDHLGTPQHMTDDRQAVVWHASYLPFGLATLSTEKVENNLRFAGQYFDKESGLHYNYFRYYDPNLGRYLQSDPIGLAGGINTYAYAYAYQNPLTNTDPTGLFVPIAIGSCAVNPACWGAVIGTGQAAINAVTLGVAGWGIYNSVSNNGSGSGSSIGNGNAGSTANCPPNDPFCQNQRPSNSCSKIKNGPKFGLLKNHAQRHGLAGQTTNQYYNAAVRHTQTGQRFTVRHNGTTKVVYLTRTGSNNFTFTSTSRGGGRIYTHMYGHQVNSRYLSNLGIRLPRGF